MNYWHRTCLGHERLIGFARRWLYHHRLIVVHERALRAMIAAARRQHETPAWKTAMGTSARLLGRFMLLAWVLLAASPVVAANPATPAELQGWESWVLHGHESRRCPWLSPGDPANEQRRICAWPGPLELAVDAAGGHFSQRWRVDIESWLALPGDQEHWPERVTADGAPAPVVARDGLPAVRVAPGNHTVAGEFHWSRRPEVLPIPAGIGIVSLTVAGNRVAVPQRTDQGIFLGRRAVARQEDQLELRAFRRLTDEQPARLLTHLELSVAGDTHEVRLPGLLPAGFVPLSLESDLTARLDPDNTLRLQLRPGRFSVEVDARGPSPVESVTLGARPAPWPAQEVWSFAGVDRLRVAAIEGAQAVDPSVANVPADWRQLPAYSVAAGRSLKVIERSRGLSSEDRNELRLSRRLWLDFSGDGYTVVDTIAGTMRRDWRLDLAGPYTLESARAAEAPLLVTKSLTPGVAGVEWRAPQVAVTAVARVSNRAAALPATGWQERFTHAEGELVLPPAYRLLAAVGPDSAPNAWIERWHLLDLFIVLLAAVTAWRLLGWPATILTLVALTLTHHEPGAPSWLWLNVLVALALVRAAPEGRLKRVASGYQLLALLLVAVVLVPFVVAQIRLAVYPQLEAGTVFEGPYAAGLGGVPARAPMNAQLAMPRQAPVAAPALEGEVSEASSVVSKSTVGGAVLKKRLDEVALTSARRAPEYEPGVLTQSGPGLPRWRYHVYSYVWRGPVEVGEKIRFVMSPPWLTRLWRVVGATLSALLLLSLSAPTRPLLEKFRPISRSSVAALLLGLVALLAAPGDARAATTPDPAILHELGKRLLAPPSCAPSCADVLAASVDAGPSRLTIIITASALDPVGLALPSGDPNWNPDRIEIDGVVAGGVYRDEGGGRYVALSRGRHVVKIEGPIADVGTLTIAFPARPHVIDVSASGWEIGGVAERRLLSGAVELARRRTAAAATGSRAPQAEFPPFVTVERNIRLGHEWVIDTRINRVAPETGAFTVKIPLLPTEELLTPELVVNDRVVSVGFSVADEDRSYNSALPQTETLELTAHRDASFGEIWRFDVGPSWHVDFKGLPAVQPEIEGGRNWRFEYLPRAGERLIVHVTRPAAVNGATLAFDRVQLDDTIGARSREARLHLEYRSTQGGRQAVRLPADARVTAVRTDGGIIALRPENGALSLPVLPGSHTIDIDWQSSAGVTWLTRSSLVSVAAPASNLSLSLTVPEDRWVLYAVGTGIGPAVLYWGELLLFLAAAVAAGRSMLTPLSSQEWLLLGLGLSTFSWMALALFAAFVLVFEWRGRAERMPLESRRFNAMQVGLAVLAVTALLALVAAVPRGLLSRPDMRIAGSYSPGDSFHWFIDQTASEVPASGLISVSLWWYKLAMLAWALWLSFALTRWVRWAWGIFRKDGLWRGRVRLPEPARPTPTATDS
jgi:hypothetical protein